MNKRSIWISSAVGAAALVLGGTAIAFATPTPGPAGDDGTDPGDQVLVGTDLERATEAAVAETGGGTVVDSEADDDGGDSAYEVEVLLDDGTVKEVELDADFNFVRFDDEGGSDDADDGANDTDDDSDDGPDDD